MGHSEIEIVVAYLKAPQFFTVKVQLARHLYPVVFVAILFFKFSELYRKKRHMVCSMPLRLFGSYNFRSYLFTLLSRRLYSQPKRPDYVKIYMKSVCTFLFARNI